MITTIIIIAHVLQRNLSSFSKSFPHNLKQSQHFTFVTGTEFFPTRVRAVNILCIGVNIDQMTLVARSRDRLANVVRYLRHPIRGSVGHVGRVTDALQKGGLFICLILHLSFLLFRMLLEFTGLFNYLMYMCTFLLCKHVDIFASLFINLSACT